MKRTISGNLMLLVVFSLFAIAVSCNMLMVAVRNVPVFFSEPRKVANKIKEPVKMDTRLSALWIGHATVLLQMDDKVIITDPFLTGTIGEFARRTVEPGIEPENITKCDVILISHSHFDHLSYGSLQLLENKGKGTSIVFPKDLENYLPAYDMDFVRMQNDNGYERKIIGETKLVNGIKITTVFAQHWAGRYGFDGYLWDDNSYTGYIIQYKGITVYFAGDTGYDSTKFKELGKLFSIDLALIPIGPCSDCRQCGTFNHVFPMDAFEIFEDLNPKWMIPIHYGTLQFAQADPIEPVYAFEELVFKNEESERIKILNIGDQYTFIKK
ncbi:MAG: MBL fold metallo-hydrolase [Ignavibacteria bacterium]|nr:MBL fold metallo-hydrolase [Ignavibacteria bacterium]